MTRTLASLVLLAALLFGACGKSDTKKEASGTDVPGKQLFSQYNCAMCHGETGEGKTSAPALRGLTAHWDRATLVRYLQDPTTFAKDDPRLTGMKETYSMSMPSYAHLGDERLGQLADYILGL